MRPLLACMTLVAALAVPVHGQELLAGGASRAPDSGAEPCAWVLVRQPSPPSDAERTDDAQVLLVPPIGADAGPRTPGVFRLVRSLENWPQALAADGNQLTIAIPSARVRIAGMQTPPEPTEVLSLWAEYDQGRWYSGPAGALDASASLPADRTVLALASTRAGLLAALGPAVDSKGPGGVTLRLLSLGAWTDVPLPGPQSATPTTVRLAATEGGAVMITAGPTLEDIRVWSAAITPAKRTYADNDDDPDAIGSGAETRTPAKVEWSEVPAPRAPAGAVALQAASVGGQVVLMWVREGSVSLVAGLVPGVEHASQWRDLSTVDGVRGEVVFAPLAGAERVVIVWREPERDLPAAATPAVAAQHPLNLKFAEVSSATGRVIAQGDVELAGPATRSDYRAVGILLAWISGIVAVIVLRPRDDRSLLMPDGLAFAEPAQRMIAGTIDLVVCLVGAGLILGRGPLEVLTTSATGLLTSTQGQCLLGLTILLGVATGTLSEWSTGRSLGKLICGCAVADLTKPVPAGAAFHRVSLVRSFTRNIVKWCIPPAGLVGALSNAGRHRGDEYSGAGVLSAVDEDGDDGPAE